MSLKTANELSENELEQVAGGLTKSNMWGDCTKYKIGMNHTGYSYYYDYTRDGEVCNILSNLDFSACKTNEDVERTKLEALKAVPGLLTAIPGCDESWY